MVKTNPLGALAATAGTLVAVGLLMLMLLAVEVRPAEAAGEVGGFNVTNNTTNDHSPSYSPSGEKIAYRVSGSEGLHKDIYTINVGGAGKIKKVTNNNTNDFSPSYSPDGKKIAYQGREGNDPQIYTDTEIYTINVGGGVNLELPTAHTTPAILPGEVVRSGFSSE
jgi:tricorn protease-like protein